MVKVQAPPCAGLVFLVRKPTLLRFASLRTRRQGQHRTTNTTCSISSSFAVAQHQRPTLAPRAGNLAAAVDTGRRHRGLEDWRDGRRNAPRTRAAAETHSYTSDGPRALTSLDRQRRTIPAPLRFLSCQSLRFDGLELEAPLTTSIGLQQLMYTHTP